jgi:hypothetical protein
MKRQCWLKAQVIIHKLEDKEEGEEVGEERKM